MLVTTEYPETVTAAQIIADNLAPLGITVNIRTVDFATWLDEQNNGHFDMLMMGWLGNIDPDDFYYAQHHTDGSSNAQKFSNREVDRLLDAGRVETNRNARGDDYAKAATLIADEASYIYLYNPSVIQAWTKRLSAAALTHPITRFIARRLLYSLVVLAGVLVAVFALVHLVPGDPVRIALGTRYTPEAYDALRSASGLDRPIVEQFFGYLASAFTGDLGVSFRNGDPVTVTLLERLPATVSLGVVGIVIAMVIALPAGIFSALREGRVSDAIVRITSQFGVSIPDFWLGILLIALFATTLGWLPTSGYRPLLEDPAGWLRHIVLPALTVGLVAAAIMTRYVRSAVLEVASMGYVRTARSKGLPPRVVTFRHTVRNALVPVLTITGIQLATILGGVIVVEVVFAWPGLGRLVYNAVAARDYPVIQGAVLLIATLFLVINLIVDVLYAVVDPRIRLA
jgi:peptide/nickel transport system permease protein